MRIGKGEPGILLTSSGWERLSQKAVAIVRDYHQRFPARTGMPKVELSHKLRAGTHSSAIMSSLTDEGYLIEGGLAVRLPSFQVQLTPAQQARIDAFMDSLAQNPYAPPSELIPEPDLLGLLLEWQEVVKLSGSVVLSTRAYEKMVEKVKAHLKLQGKITLAEARDMFQTSRKYAQALLEHLDSKKITRRVGDERVLYRVA